MQIELTETCRARRWSQASRASAILAAVCITLAGALPAAAATLERIKESGRIKLGYLSDARPFSYRSATGAAEGYAVSLCEQVVAGVKKQLALPQLAVEWIPVTMNDRLSQVQQGGIDLLCAPTGVTLQRRAQVSFSIPIFLSGTRAVVRADAPQQLREALATTRVTRVVWRGSPAAKLLQQTKFVVVAGTATQKWLLDRRSALQIDSRVVVVPDYRSALQRVLDHKADVFFGDRALVLGAIKAAQREDLLILDRLFTHDLPALALAANDDDFRLLVDRVLSQTYASPEFGDLYRQWFGALDANTRSFFLLNTFAE